MINITDKAQCCGCSACVQRCPKLCISMHSDVEGFMYPMVDTSICIDCHLCERVCPVINQDVERKPLEVFAARGKDYGVRMQSSSGGLFTLLAEQTIGLGGVVFGARWDADWNVRHDYAEKVEDIVQFRSSKYLQSIIGESYRKAEMFLKEGRKVMFTGTPCQIAGLRHFLCKDYDNLLAVDVICHSVPSPSVWQQYLQEKLRSLKWDKSDIWHISFRDKTTGWMNYSFVMENKGGDRYAEPGGMNAFMRGFRADLYSRPSCHTCPAKRLKSGSDITLGDFWGIESLMSELDDGNGVSAVIANTERGKKAMHNLDVQLHALPYEKLTKRNLSLVRSAGVSKNRMEFFKKDGKTLEEKVMKLVRVRFSWRAFIVGVAGEIIPIEIIKRMIKRMIKR